MKPFLKGLAIVCVATVIAEGIGLGYLWADGKFAPDKRLALLAALHGVDMDAMRREATASESPPHNEQPSFAAIEDARFVAALDLDLREMAVEKALADFQYLQEQVETEYAQYRELKENFDTQWKALQGAAAVPELQEVLQTLQALSPKQAKQQLLQLLGDGLDGQVSKEDKQRVYDVVTLVKAMPLDKRKKIFAEFRSPQEVERLGDILALIRQGIPEMEVIRKTREQLEQFNQRLARG